MGYYTRFNLEWFVPAERENVELNSSDSSRLDDQIKIYLEHNSDTYYGIDSDGNSRDECKWYDHVKDMTTLSKHFPTVLFKMAGVGEETEDHWIRYYLGGKCQLVTGRIVFDGYDPSKLK